ncbi:MAG TPA: hypothetical protein EYQ50_14420 [Verrucomicrobiales bacterium]|nr:hypothetical protein [Verrucomicrobiales bacterium]HIL71389.1 hypothetical protein [Verrucomicrobiota bacterium]
MTKAITSVAVRMLVAEVGISSNDPIEGCLPEFAYPRVYTEPGESAPAKLATLTKPDERRIKLGGVGDGIQEVGPGKFTGDFYCEGKGQLFAGGMRNPYGVDCNEGDLQLLRRVSSLLRIRRSQLSADIL